MRAALLRTSGLVVVAAAAAAAVAVAHPALAEDVGAFRSKVEKWVETRQILSEEESEWRVEEQTLRDSRDLLRREKKALEAEIAELEASNTAVDEERRDLLLQRGDHQRASRALEEEIRAMEEQVLALAPRLPEPLLDKLEPLLVQIPEEDPEGADLQLGQRLMNVLGVLAQAERWNGTANFVGETRAVGGDQKVQVRTLYWGLGQAVYVDAQGRSAGVGRPGPEGWEFTSRPELVDAARKLLDIYEGNVDAIEFVEIPVEIQ